MRQSAITGWTGLCGAARDATGMALAPGACRLPQGRRHGQVHCKVVVERDLVNLGRRRPGDEARPHVAPYPLRVAPGRIAEAPVARTRNVA